MTTFMNDLDKIVKTGMKNLTIRKKMNSYSVITYAVVTTEYLVKANSKEEAEEKYHGGEHYDTNELDIHDERIEAINLNEENVDDR